ncbi:hypothetical protein ACS127_12890 [Amphibacillus sp. Q70]|uniref:hypothetical protein n=1 Tax=Amphibacillus sp. Q70 TaxID=3453416 RepID=UPI003F8585BF
MKGDDYMLTNKDILHMSMKQSAIDLNCGESDFLNSENKIVVSRNHSEARKYLDLPFDCHLVSYGNNIVASINEEYREVWMFT